MSSPIIRKKRNFDNDTCCEAYCPCCLCKQGCDCSCNCSKTKMIIPTFVLSALAFILIMIEMMTKVSDTNTYIDFKKNKNKHTVYKEYLYDFDNILNIEDSEDKYTLALIIIALFIFFVYLILLICFLYENQCFEGYNPKCKRPYYMLLMILNLIADVANGMICFIFFSYRVNSINEYRNYKCFSSKFRETNFLNMSLNIISAICYLLCLIFHLITCFYLFKEDGICAGCCSEFLNCISCCKSCFKCCCCCKDSPEKNRPIVLQRRSVAYVPHNALPVIQFNNSQQRNSMFLQNQMAQESSQLRNYINEDVRNKIEANCKNATYNESYSKYTTCNLCKNNFKNGEQITELKCGHIYHKNCAYNYFVTSKLCPDDGNTVIN